MEVSLPPFKRDRVLILAHSQGYELVTPPLDGMILPGVTRDSVLTLAREHSSNSNRLSGLPDNLTVSERSITMREVKEASETGKLVELFGAGMSSLTPFSLQLTTFFLR
jgi:branched-chain amino acid aminotransferase